MFRFHVVALAAALTWAAFPFPAGSEEWEGDPGNPPAQAAPSGPNGEVSVDIEGATPGLDYDVFRNTLNPYGDWFVSARYGNVWRPRVAIGWRPYYYGAWQWSDEGWYWDSSEPFAWAVYHYGRWVYDPAWGWVWVPGYQWAPAWVTWRYGPDAVGWAPLGPGVSVFVTSYPFIDFWWTFVPTVQFVGVPVYTVAYPPREVPRWYRGTAPAPPRTGAAPPHGSRLAPAPAWGGPARSVIETRLGRPVTAFRRDPAWRAGAGTGERERSPAFRETPGRGETTRTPALREAPGREQGSIFRGAPSSPERERSPAAPPVMGGRGERDRGAPTWQRPEPERARPEFRPAPREEPRQQGGGRGGGGGSPPSRSRGGRER